MSRYKTDHKRARGLGAAGHGAGHWIAERVSAVALAPLCLWAVYSTILLARADYGMAVNWVSQPLNAVLLSLLIVASFWHMHAGMRVIIEDYLHKNLGKWTSLILNFFVAVLGGALALFSVLKVAFTGGGF